MTTWQLIRTLIHKGFSLEVGQHYDYRGYYAVFSEKEGRLPPDEWACAGHGLTPHRAVVMAAKLALGKPVTIPPPEEFR